MNNLISYAEDFVSFFIYKTKNLSSIKNIILFGSVARMEATENSDIDLFIDVIDKQKKIEEEIKTIEKDFFNSVKYEKYWKLLNVKNDFKVIVDNIENWKLKDTIYGEAIILYGKYSPKIEKENNVVIFSWENIKPNSKRVLFNKKMFGYTQKGKYYDGLLQKYSGQKWSKGTLMFKVEYINEVLALFRRFRIAVKINKGSIWK